MRRHAKASNSDRALGRASIVRALATLNVARDGSRSSASPHLRVGAQVGLLAALLTTALLVLTGPASAALVHPYESQITEANGNPFTNPWGLAIDGSDNLWVSDVGAGLIDKFDPSGNLLAQGDGDNHWTGVNTRSIAFSVATNRLYVADSARDDLWVLNADASFNSNITGPWGSSCCYIYAAADNSGGATDGSVYVTSDQFGLFRIDGAGNPSNFSASASYISGNQITGTSDHSFSRPEGVAVDTEGNVYVVDSNNGDVDQFDPTGNFISSFSFSGRPSAVAVSPVTGNVLIIDDSSGVVREFDSSGNFILDITGSNTPAGSFSPQGLAIDSTGTIYVSDKSNKVVNVFQADTLLLPGVKAAAATGIAQHAATLNGSVDPDGIPVTGCSFEYTTNADFQDNKWGNAEEAPCTPSPGDGSDPVEVSAEIAGLAAETTYHFRLGSSSADGVARSTALFFTTAPNVKAVLTKAATAITNSTATLNGSLDPDGSPILDCRFEYGIDATYGNSVPCAADPGSGTGVVDVSADIGGLQANTNYHFRLSATNINGTTVGSDATLLTLGPPILGVAAAAPRTTTSARLNAYINPRETATKYYFDFGPDAEYGEVLPVSQAAEAGAGTDPLLVSENIDGLLPATTYHYRVVAENAYGTTIGSDVAFTTRTAAEMALPERGIELVSSPEKGNQNVAGDESKLTMTDDGDHALWTVAGGAPGSTTGTLETFLATRGPNGWQSKTMLPPVEKQIGAGDWVYELAKASPDFSSGVFMIKESGVGTAGYAFARTTPDGSQETFTDTFQPDNISANSLIVTPDLVHVLYRAPNFGDGQIYDYGSGTPKVISLMPTGSPSPCGGQMIQFGGTALGGISDDGSHVYFVSSGNNCANPVELYLRNTATGTTTLVSGPPASGARLGAKLIRMSVDGTEAVFLTRTALLSEDTNTEASFFNNGADIYKFVENQGLECLTCASGLASVRQATASEDLSRVYFTSRNRLVAGVGIQDEENLYVIHDGSLGFVSSDVDTSLDRARLTSNGDTLLFYATARDTITTDNISDTCQRRDGTPTDCKALYRYDSSDGSVECVSCTHAGTTVAKRVLEAEYALSADGNVVVFRTPEDLVHDDVNGAEDIYEWRNGAVGLVTDGETEWPGGSQSELRLRGISDDADDIGFSVAAFGLTGFELDGLASLYDARVGGGFQPATPPAICNEDSCQGPLVTPPALRQAGSSSFNGPGNQRRTHKRAARHCRSVRGGSRGKHARGSGRRCKPRATRNRGANRG